jgi:hypothetical protein
MPDPFTGHRVGYSIEGADEAMHASVGSGALSDDVLNRLHEILKAHPEGISEYDLLRELEQTYQASFARAPFRNDLALFQAHFLLFNALYRLRDWLAANGQAWLEIDTLGIVLHSRAGLPSSEPWALARRDPLRDYYLDINQLAETDAEQIAELLGGFWMRYFALENRAAALAVLGLTDPVSAEDVTRRYRELAMRLHPDRGGNAESFQRLLSARRVLERCGNCSASKRT